MATSHTTPSGRSGLSPSAATAPVGLSWLITVRWTTMLAGAGAVAAGHSALQLSAPAGPAAVTFAGWVLSNLWLTWKVRTRSEAGLRTIAGLLVSADVLLLSWLLWTSGGVLNPASVFYLVQIVVAALVLGRWWTWFITAMAVGGYAGLFFGSPRELHAAEAMHPEIALHIRGMWLAFALTALIIAVLVVRLVTAIERRDVALETLRGETARAARMASLATLAAGAAHELSTPLGTIALAAGELERSLQDGNGRPTWRQDAALIRAETSRCRQILDAMAAGSGEVAGEAPRATSVADVVAEVRDRLDREQRARVIADVPGDLAVVWPVGVVCRALGNLVQNALHAAGPGEPVRVQAHRAGDAIRIAVIDRGAGMTPEDLKRAGEPFFTTKPAGVGTGLGLFVAQASIRQLGGDLMLASAVGQGTTAAIHLPPNVVTDAGAGHA